MSKIEINSLVSEIRDYLLELNNPVKLLKDCLENKEFSKWVCTPEFLKKYLIENGANTLKTKNNTYLDALNDYVNYITSDILNIVEISDIISNVYDEDRFVNIEEEMAISYGEKIQGPDYLDDSYSLKYINFYYIPSNKYFAFIEIDDIYTSDVSIKGVLMEKPNENQKITFFDNLEDLKDLKDLDEWVRLNIGPYIIIKGTVKYNGKSWEETKSNLN